MADVDIRLREADLIIRCQQGDLTAFDTLIGLHAGRVYNLAYRMLGSQQDAEDAAQEAFLRAFSALKKFRRGSAFSTWLYRIASNVCLDELKRRRARPKPFSSLIDPHEQEETLDLADKLAMTASENDPAEIIARRADQAEVECALASLPEQQRAVVVMCDIEELSYEEAAEALDTNVGTVKSRLHRARQRLKQLLAAKRELAAE